MRDLDILIAPEHAARAQSVLEDLGYERMSQDHNPLADHELPPMQLPGQVGSVELHIAVLMSRWQHVMPANAELLAAGQMTTTEAVLHGIVHAQLQDESYLLGRIPLRSVYECAMVANGPLAAEIDWEWIRSQLKQFEVEYALDAHLGFAVDLFAASVPAATVGRKLRWNLALAQYLVHHPRTSRNYERLRFSRQTFSHTRLQAIHGSGSWIRLVREHLRTRR